MPAVLEGKVALVTGVSYDGQIGQAVAKKLAESGAALAICARTQSNVEARASALPSPSLTEVDRACLRYRGSTFWSIWRGALPAQARRRHSLDDWTQELTITLSAF